MSNSQTRTVTRNGISATMQKGGNIYEAHRQWASRPADECFPTVAALHEFCADVRSRSVEPDYDLSQIRVVTDEHILEGDPSAQESDVDIYLKLNKEGYTENDGITHFTNFSFKQFSSFVGAPAEYLSTLPAHLVARNLNHGIDTAISDSRPAKLLLYTSEDGSRVYTRAATSKRYDRAWNADITSLLNRFDPSLIGPPVQNAKYSEGSGTGLYASAHDMFAFMVAYNNYIDARGAELVRGFYISNNEVGTGSLRICMFLCDYICANHIIWDVEKAMTFSFRHIGSTATTVVNEYLIQLIGAALVGEAGETEDRIRLAQAKQIAPTKEKVVQYLFEKRYATKKLAEAAYVNSEVRHQEYGHCDPNTVWGMVSGMTAEAKGIQYYDQRENVEAAAARLWKLVA